MAVADPTTFQASFSRVEVVRGYAIVDLEPFAYVRTDAVAGD